MSCPLRIRLRASQENNSYFTKIRRHRVSLPTEFGVGCSASVRCPSSFVLSCAVSLATPCLPSVPLLDGNAEVIPLSAVWANPPPIPPFSRFAYTAPIQRVANPVRNPHSSLYPDANWPFCDCAVGAQNRTTIPKRTVGMRLSRSDQVGLSEAKSAKPTARPRGTSQNGLFSRVALATCVLLHVRSSRTAANAASRPALGWARAD